MNYDLLIVIAMALPQGADSPFGFVPDRLQSAAIGVEDAQTLGRAHIVLRQQLNVRRVGDAAEPCSPEKPEAFRLFAGGVLNSMKHPAEFHGCSWRHISKDPVIDHRVHIHRES